MSNYDDEKMLKCSFCGKPQNRVRKLIAGPGVYICDDNRIDTSYFCKRIRAMGSGSISIHRLKDFFSTHIFLLYIVLCNYKSNVLFFKLFFQFSINFHKKKDNLFNYPFTR